ncbi:50S ribosomal protein L15 [Candidatus Pelagibacter sp.]|nr:50S ribosomal protein L15 [Candidatus Pelagibacter sp.]
MTTLNSTTPIKIKKIRVGRGIGSGKGKTSGRGVKGQKSRSGVSIKSFEGGQMPLFRRLPKRGFNSMSKKKTAVLSLNFIQNLIDKNKFSSNETLNIEMLKKEKIIKKSYNMLSVLGNGEIRNKLKINVHHCSASAKQKIEKAGGSISIIKAEK